MEDVDIFSALIGTMQYGILGVVALTLAYFAKNQWKRLEQKNRELEEKVDKLQEDMRTLLTEDRSRMAILVQDNTKAMQELSRIVLEYIVNKE
jgi:Mg2+/citrate symporter